MDFMSTIMSPGFLAAVGSIVLIDLLLAGDNAVVIAMASRGLPPAQRKKAIYFGSLAAVLMRVVLTFFVSQLLQVSFVKLVGGVLILWIAAKLFVHGDGHEEGGTKTATSVWGAVKLILIADATMSLDNMLAVGGASHGNVYLLIFGLAVSIPFVIFTSNILSKLMDKFPVIVYVGAAILGKVGAEMIFTDPFVAARVTVSHTALRVLEVLFAGGIVAFGYFMTRRSKARPATALEAAGPGVGQP
jgi:YjbE family integral membrane protein